MITETKRKGEGSENIREYDYSGVPKDMRSQKGVAILVRKKLRKHITSSVAISKKLTK